MNFMGREFWGWVGIGAAMSSRSSQQIFSGKCGLHHAAHLRKHIGTSSNILVLLLQLPVVIICNSLRRKGYHPSKL